MRCRTTLSCMPVWGQAPVWMLIWIQRLYPSQPCKVGITISTCFLRELNPTRPSLLFTRQSAHRWQWGRKHLTFFRVGMELALLKHSDIFISNHTNWHSGTSFWIMSLIQAGMTHRLSVLTSEACWLQPQAPGDGPRTLSHQCQGDTHLPSQHGCVSGLRWVPPPLAATTLLRLEKAVQESYTHSLITLTNGLSQHKTPWNLYPGVSAQACMFIFNYNIA